MSETPHPLTIHRLSEAKTFNEAVAVWMDHADELSGYMFVLSSPETAGGPLWPPRLDLAGKGHLRSLFAHPRLWFVSHEILEAMTGPRGKVVLPIDYSIAFDTNAASYLRAMVEGSAVEVVQVFQQVLRQMAGRRFNWDLMPFFSERSADLQSGESKALEGIWRTVLAAERFATCDMERFAETGEIKPRLREQEIVAKAQEQLSLWDSMLKAGIACSLREQHRLFYLMALKVALLEHQHPGRSEAERKMTAFITFLQKDVSAMFLNMLWAAGRYFQDGGGFRPFSKLASRGEQLLRNAANVAWDLHHVTMRRQFAGTIGRGGAFYVPYFLSFDGGLTDLIDGYPQRSCLVRSGSFPQFFADLDMQAWLLENWHQPTELLMQCFSIEGHQERKERHKKQGPTNPEPIIARFEAEIRALG